MMPDLRKGRQEDPESEVQGHSLVRSKFKVGLVTDTPPPPPPQSKTETHTHTERETETERQRHK